MHWQESLESVKRHPMTLALGIFLAGGAGFLAGIAWLDGRIETKIRESEHLRIQIRALEARAMTPGPQGEAGPKGDQGLSINIPAGAVVAFDIREGCPKGWIAYSYSDYPAGATYGGGTPDGTYGTGTLDQPQGTAKPYTCETPPCRQSKNTKTGREYGFIPGVPLEGKVYTEPLKGKGTFSPSEPYVPGRNVTADPPVNTELIVLQYCKKLPDSL